MKRIAIILFFTLVWFSVFTQTIKFNNTYSPFTYQEADNIFEYNDGYLMLGGGIDINDPGQKIKIIVYYLDHLGDVNWIKTYGDTVYNYYFGDRNSLIRNFDNGFSLSGARTGEGNITCMLTKFDQNMDTLWTKLYFNNPDFTTFYNHIQTSDGGYALVGCNDQFDPDGDVLLVKTDSDGNMQWYKRYGTGARDMGLCIVITEDGGYLIGGSTDGLGNTDGYLLKTDNEGNLEWTKHYGNPLYPDGGIFTIVKTDDNNYIIPLSSYATESLGSDFYSREYSIIKLDSDFNEVWYKNYGVNAEYSGLGTITISENGDIMCTVSDDHIGGLMRVSPEGNIIWTKHYNPDGSVGENGLLAMKQTEDKGFIMAGVAYDPQVMWLVKTDSCGCITEDCECGGSAVQQVFANNEITFYPNPAGNVLHFDMPERSQDINIEIYDNLGRLLITNELLGWQNTIDVSQLKHGNYYVRIVADGESWSGWFVKE